MKVSSLLIDSATNLNNYVVPDGMIAKISGSNAFKVGNGKSLFKNLTVTADTSTNSTKGAGATKYVSTAAPSGGVNGDIWFQYI